MLGEAIELFSGQRLTQRRISSRCWGKLGTVIQLERRLALDDNRGKWERKWYCCLTMVVVLGDRCLLWKLV